MHDFGFGSLGWIWMVLYVGFWLAVVGGVVWLVVWAIRRATTGNPNSGAVNYGNAGSLSPSAKDIAQIRYARGEITREEYQRLVDDLLR